jgi:hypothetical protein
LNYEIRHLTTQWIGSDPSKTHLPSCATFIAGARYHEALPCTSSNDDLKHFAQSSQQTKTAFRQHLMSISAAPRDWARRLGDRDTATELLGRETTLCFAKSPTPSPRSPIWTSGRGGPRPAPSRGLRSPRPRRSSGRATLPATGQHPQATSRPLLPPPQLRSQPGRTVVQSSRASIHRAPARRLHGSEDAWRTRPDRQPPSREVNLTSSSTAPSLPDFD